MSALELEYVYPAYTGLPPQKIEVGGDVAAIADGTYPSPPARFENLATKGKPTGIVLEFIKWILTDGQQYLEQAGYVQLTPEQVAESLAKIK